MCVVCRWGGGGGYVVCVVCGVWCVVCGAVWCVGGVGCAFSVFLCGV